MIHPDPRTTFEMTLDSFADWPDAERPAFRFRRLTGAEYLRMATMPISDDDHETQRVTYETFAVGLVGWRNQRNPATGELVDFPSDPAELPRVLETLLTPPEAFAVIDSRLRRGGLNADSKKKSESRP